MYWSSYNDDAILLWTGSEEELLSFHQYLSHTNKKNTKIEYNKNLIQESDFDQKPEVMRNVRNAKSKAKNLEQQTLLKKGTPRALSYTCIWCKKIPILKQPQKTTEMGIILSGMIYRLIRTEPSVSDYQRVFSQE